MPRMSNLNEGRRPRPVVDLAPSLATASFTSLRRRAQRHYAQLYVHGLLTAAGRKNIRNIASAVDPQDTGLAQALHHFIAKSPWDWVPVRQSAARYLDQLVRPEVWVAAPLVIPKAGPHSVGVQEVFNPALGQQGLSQRAYGVWLIGNEGALPVNWRIHLPDRWLEDERRQQAGIPHYLGPGEPGACLVQAVSEAVEWGLTRRPVIIDGEETDPTETVKEFVARDIPFLLRVRCSTRIVPNGGNSVVSALHYASTLVRRQQPTAWRHPSDPPHRRRVSLAAMGEVRLPQLSENPAVPSMNLLCEWVENRKRPAGFWLAGPAAGASAQRLLHMAKSALRVTEDIERTGAAVGLRDFEGRSFRGWHHHMTLATIAHCATVLGTSRHDTVLRTTGQDRFSA
jgi:SRSO17 transposase